MKAKSKVEILMDNDYALQFAMHLIDKHNDEHAEKWLMKTYDLDYGDARAVIRYAQSLA